MDYCLDYAYLNETDCAYDRKTAPVCAVCDREVLNGEACYCFEGNVVCENCCSEYIMDHYWYASPADL